MTGDDYIDLATQLLAGGSEPHFRTAVSRAYYGAFHIGREFVRSCGILMPASPEAHKHVRWCLANAGSRELDDAAVQLESLRSARNKADYDLSNRGFAKLPNVTIHVRRAASMAAAIRAAKAADVAPAMRAYAQRVNLLLDSP
ncbi:MAG TPA: hypothetical protein VF278_25140 [Pirellulales bacterium]